MKTTVGSNIKQHRTERKMTQQQLADSLSVSRQTITSYESGRTEPDIATMEKLAEIFEISVDELLGKTKIEKAKYSSYKPFFAVGIALNSILFIRNMLFLYKGQIFLCRTGGYNR